LSFGILFLVSVVGGFAGAMGGMGGGIVLIPALTFLGMDIKHAIAVSLLSVIATSSGSAAAYVRDRLTNLKLGMFLEAFTMLGALAGARLTLSIRPQALFFFWPESCSAPRRCFGRNAATSGCRRTARTPSPAGWSSRAATRTTQRARS